MSMGDHRLVALFPEVFYGLAEGFDVTKFRKLVKNLPSLPKNPLTEELMIFPDCS